MDLTPEQDQGGPPRQQLSEMEFLQKSVNDLSAFVNEISFISDAARKIISAHDANEVIGLYCMAVREHFKLTKFQLLIFDDDKLDFVPASPEECSCSYKPSIPQTVFDWLLTERKPTSYPDKNNQMVLLMPLVLRDDVLGVLCADVTGMESEISQQMMQILEMISNQTAAALVNVRLFDQLAKQFGDLTNVKSNLQNTLESINNGIITLNIENHIVMVNKNASLILEVAPEDAVGKDIASTFSGNKEFVDVLSGVIAETGEMGFAMEQQAVFINSTGLELPLAISTSILRNDRLENLGMIVILRDMTASKELERLRNLDQLKSMFVANVSHELRTPLTSIRAYTEALLDMDMDETQTKFLKVIDSESERLLSLIEDLLNVSRIESGKLTLNFEPVRPAELVEEIMSVSKVHSTVHKLVTKVAPDLPRIMLDRNKIKEVMINLVSNAIKYSPDGGEVTVVIALEGENLRIDVSDQGMGISKENIKKLFQQFYRVDSSLTAKISGTGLGLAITKSIVEAHGGAMLVQSEPGKGSTFTALLPARKSSSSPTGELA